MPNEIELLAEVRALCSSGEAKRIRTEAHFSIGDVAAHIGTQPSSVSRWERGVNLPVRRTALKYGELLRTLQKSIQKASVAEIRQAAEAKAAREAAAAKPTVDTATRAG